LIAISYRAHVVQNLIRAFGFLQESWGSRGGTTDDEPVASEARSLHEDGRRVPA